MTCLKYNINIAKETKENMNDHKYTKTEKNTVVYHANDVYCSVFRTVLMNLHHHASLTTDKIEKLEGDASTMQPEIHPLLVFKSTCFPSTYFTGSIVNYTLFSI